MQSVEIPQRIIDRAREDSPEGFEVFYMLVHGVVPPEHIMAWVHDLYESQTAGKYYLNEAFRGSTKSTTWRTFITHQVGLYPDLSYMFLQVKESRAQEQIALVANTIEHNPAWKVVFPNVIPDKKAGWGDDKGYYVTDSSIPYDAWMRARSKDPHPTIIGYGRTSKAVIGTHPTGGIFIDDLDDEGTTRSERELAHTRTLLTGTMFPAANTSKYFVVVGTPWNERDVIAYCKSTGEFVCSRTPVYTDGDPTWIEIFDEARIRKERNLAGEIEFARMYLLDLEAAKGQVLKKEWWSYYPYEEIPDEWPMYVGVDYASTADQQKSRIKQDYSKQRDFFALAIGRVSPQGTLIVTDGYMARVSHGEAKQKVIALSSANPYLRMIAVEAIGTGKTYYDELFAAQLHVPIMPLHSHAAKDGIGRVARKKGERFEWILSPLVQQGRILMSDKITEFLKSLTDQWIGWDGTETGFDDALDALYMLYMAAAADGRMKMPQMQKVQQPHLLFEPKKKESTNPFADAGSWK